jgi:hypothetical protein
MLSRYLSRIALLFAITATAVSCTGRRTGVTPGAEAPTSRVPFAAAEPESFQAKIIVTAGDLRRESFIARSGEKRRSEWDVGSRSSIVQLVSGRTNLLLPEKAVFAEIADGTGDPRWRSDAVVLGWLNARGDSTFEKLDEVDGTTRYRVRFSEGAAAEALIWIDPASGFPLRQEFYGIENGERILTMTIEVDAFRIPADDSLFEIPANYRKVSESELRAMHRENRND